MVLDMYRKILVATMGEYMDELIEHTLELLHGREAEVLCLYVVDTSVPFLTPRKIKQMMAKELRQREEKIIEEMKKGLDGPQNPNIKFKGVIREGDPAEELLNSRRKKS